MVTGDGEMKRFQYSQAEKEIMESSVIPFAVYQFIDQRVVTVLLTKGFMDFFGIEDKDEAYYIMDNHMYKDAHPDDVARISDDALRFATGQIPEYNVIYRSLKDGEYRVVHAFGKHISPKEGVRVAMIWYVNEGSYMGDELIHDDSLTRNYSISLYESSLSRKNNYDFLTGLPNMTYFYELARSNREIAVENGRNCALGFANLNGMKYYNKKYGFLEGDRMLRNFAELLTEHFGINNSCRIAQDSFAFFYDGDGPEKHVAKLFDEFALRCGDKPITVRAGIYLSTMGIVEISIACDRARYACNTLKNSNRSAYAFFDEEMLAYENNRQYIVDNIEKALSERWIQAYYQPIVRSITRNISDTDVSAMRRRLQDGLTPLREFFHLRILSLFLRMQDLYIRLISILWTRYLRESENRKRMGFLLFLFQLICLVLILTRRILWMRYAGVLMLPEFRVIS